MARTAKTIVLAGTMLTALFACAQTTTEEETEEQDDAVVTGGATVPRLGTRIDRIGRPEITNFVVKAPALKEIYNAEDSFAVSPESVAQFTGVLKASLAKYDTYDSVVDMDDGMLTKLAEVLVDDTLAIDLAKPCAGVSSTSYFDIERAQITGAKWTSCGGRSPNEDVVDTLITIYTNGPSKLTPRVSDGVDRSTGVAGETFPYLAKPHK